MSAHARHHPFALSARLSLFPGVGQGQVDGARRGTAAPAGRVVLPAAAAVTAPGHGRRGGAGGGLAPYAHGGGRLIAGGVLCLVGCAPNRLQIRAAKPGGVSRPRPGPPHWRATQWHQPEEIFYFEAAFVDELEQLAQEGSHTPGPELALIAQGDEVLDWREMRDRYPRAQQIILPGNDHAISDFALHLDGVLEFLELV